MSIHEASPIDAIVRRVTVLLGVIALVLGIATVLLVNPLVDLLPSSYVMVVTVGALAFVGGLWMARQRYRAGIEELPVPNVERVLSTSAPGHDIDLALYRLTKFREGTIEYRELIQERLAEVALAVIKQRDDCSREEAIESLRDGSWTSNQYAQAFFTGGSPPSQTWQEKLKNRIRRTEESNYQKWVRMTIDAIVERSHLEDAIEPDHREDDGATEDEVASFTKGEYRRLMDESRVEEVRGAAKLFPIAPTGSWLGVSAFALVAAGWGIVTFEPGVVLISVVAIGFAAYARSGQPPQLENVSIERHLSETTPQPGEAVNVTVEVTNNGASFIPDLRIVDVIPAAMEVVDGSPRLATSLTAGSSDSFRYTVIAERGTHAWPSLTIGRNWAGSIEQQALIENDAEMVCYPFLRTTGDAPVRSQTSLYSGQIDTVVGGSGLEFFALREYRPGDPMKRIDWSRLARTGEFATIDFRKEQAAKVLLLFDTRDSAYVSDGPGRRHAVDRCIDAGTELFAGLYERGDLVGVAAFDTVPCWVGPSTGDGHAEQVRRVFAHHPALSSIPPDLLDKEEQYIDPMTHIRRQLSPDIQVILFSPLCDQYTADVARRLDSVGHLVTVLSPDPTTGRTPGQRLTKVEREVRINGLREHGIRVIDWKPDQSLHLEIDRARRRWAA